MIGWLRRGSELKVIIDIDDKYAGALSITCTGLEQIGIRQMEMYLTSGAFNLENGTHFKVDENGKIKQKNGK